MALELRDTQTQVKHLILASYMDAWAGIIVNGLSWIAKERAKRGLDFRSRLLYVDGFSYKGRFAGDTGEVLRKGTPDSETWGSPVLGIQALAKAQEYARKTHGFHIETVAILSEEDEDDFNDLQESIALAGFSDKLVTNPQRIAPTDGQIVAIHGDFLRYLDSVIALADAPYTKSFFLLDPYGPKGIPYSAVSCVIKLKSADVMINFPYQDLHKKQGILSRTEEKPGDRALLANYDAMYGTQEWRARRQEAIANAADAEVGRFVEEALARYYVERLQEADPAIAVKHIELQFPDRYRTMFYLYLTTHDPTGALTLNEVLHEAKLTEYELKWNLQQAKWIHDVRQTGQLFLLDPEPTPTATDTRNVDIPALANSIWQEFAGHSRTLRQVYMFLANSDMYPSDVGKALTNLKRQKLAEYEKQQMDAPIRFIKKGRP